MPCMRKMLRNDFFVQELDLIKLVTSSNALVTSSFLLLVGMHLLLVAMHLVARDEV